MTPDPTLPQTEQDSRMMAMMAKNTGTGSGFAGPGKGYGLPLAYELSEKFEIPVMLRPHHPGVSFTAGYCRKGHQ